MSIVFFEDMPERIKLFKKKITHVQIAKTIKECITKLKEEDCSILFLGMNNYKNGKVVEWIIDKEPVIRQVIFYSYNVFSERQTSIKILQKFKYKTEYVELNKLIERLEDFKS